MTAETAMWLTHRYLTDYGLEGWQVAVVERFTSELLKDFVGYCELSAKTIWFTAAGIKRDPKVGDARAVQLVWHEVAHAIAPVADDPHGPAWKAAFLEMAYDRTIRK